MTISFQLSRLAVAAACLALPFAAQAEDTKVLKDRDITESALIQALTPESGAPAGGGEPGIRTRSIKVLRDTPGSAQPADRPVQAAKKAQASLLITFQTNSAELTPRAKSSLDVVAKALQADKLASFRFAIEGHADPRGGSDLNLRLSQARAESVVNYLVTQHGIARDRLKPEGKGATQLVNTSDPDAPENRRVTITTIQE